MDEKSPGEKAEDWKWKAELEKQLKRQEGMPPREIKSITRAFTVPLSGRGIFILVFGALLIRLGALLPMAGSLVPLLVYSYVMEVIAAAAHGKDSLPPWKMEDLWEEIVRGIKFVGIIIAAFLPAIVLFFSVAEFSFCGSGGVLIPEPWMIALIFVLVAAGAFCLPTMLLIGSISGSFLKAFNLLAVGKVIGRVFLPYLLVFILCLLSGAGLISANFGIRIFLGEAGTAVRLAAGYFSTLLSFYCLLVMGFMVGRFFYCEERNLF